MEINIREIYSIGGKGFQKFVARPVTNIIICGDIVKTTQTQRYRPSSKIVAINPR